MAACFGATAMLVLGVFACAARAAVSAYPDRPVRLIVPFPPGGANDIAARLVSQKLAERWGRAVVIDNRAGAGGNIGTEIGAKASADGYTLTIGSTSTLSSNVSLLPSLPFDPVRDFAPIAMLTTAPYVLIVHPSVGASSMQEFVQLAKKSPGKLNYSSFGEGSSAHLVVEMFKSMAGVDIVHVPYKGGGPALAAVVGGEVQTTFGNLGVVLQQVQAGRVRALAVSSRKRAVALPQTPTVAESGIPEFDATAWVGLFGPRALPQRLVESIHRDVAGILADAEMKKQVIARGMEPGDMTPEQLGRHVRIDIERWRKVVKAAGIQAR